MRMKFDAYLDIETTGLSPVYGRITVIGMYLVNDKKSRLVQLVDEKVTEENLRETIEGVHKIYTYNGRRFDLPFIKACLEVDLEALCLDHHHDLMYDCWDRNLRGGFKKVEEQLCIPRRLKGIDGLEAVRLWRRYKNDCDEDALKTLLEYNREDVMNLKVLKEKLKV